MATPPGQQQPMMLPPGMPVGAVISIDTMYQLLLRTHDTVTQMATRLEDSERQTDRTLSQHAGRISSLERWRLMHVATGAGTAGVVSWLMKATGHG